MNPSAKTFPSTPGTYALLLALERPIEIAVGSLVLIRFVAPFYVYLGSAFGAGGLAARLRHHLRKAERPHWHIDHLRSAASIRGVWFTEDARRLECDWSEALAGLCGASLVVGFGSSDCACASHLVALWELPGERLLRAHLRTGELASPSDQRAEDSSRS